MDNTIQSVRLFAADIRIQTIRAMSLAGGGHVGGAMSMSDLVSVLYSTELNCRPDQPDWPGRDYLVCSKGHSGPAIYSALALRGFFPLEWLEMLNKPGTHLPSHVDRKKTPGIDASTGSLGQGLSIACGIAKAHKQNKAENKVFVIMGDGELQEGQIWEAAMFAAHYKLDNLIAFVDANKGQLDGNVADIMDVESIEKKFESFNWNVQRINGHDIEAIQKAIRSAREHKGSPNVIILNTVKGYGCSFAMGVFNHHVYINAQQAGEAIAQLEAEKSRILAE